ncbi:hypothetical protein AGOR_G00069050 [Albula goreensis]|uniref:BCL-6 corepressor PCGF1 binding domain-containing protein n=1 Tax=Albula goreensis TaxID=1534307 RepID=A0A8T3DTM7_9TELE|nr:hypothetical protein AGOR_G00069050 [Albula goreensis]
MQVDPTSMNVGDGGLVIAEPSAPNKASRDCDVAGAPILSPSSAIVASPQKSAEVPKPSEEGPVVFPAQQWAGGKKAPLNPSHGVGVNQGKRTHVQAQAQSVISLPAGFQCSSLFKPGQPVAFLPSFSSPLCKITLPPGLGQITALREATASQVRVECRPQGTTSSVATQNLRTYPYHFTVARAVAPETRPPSATTVHKHKHRPVSDSKSCRGGAEHGSPMDSITPPTVVAHPVNQPTLGPAAPLPPVSVSSSSPPTNTTAHSKLLNHLEKGPPHQNADNTSITYSRLKSPCVVVEEHMGSEVRDVPLDLSSKSKRAKVQKDPQSASPAPAAERHLADTGQGGSPVLPKRANFGSSGAPVHMFPDSLRNGTPPKQVARLLNHQAVEPLTPWAKSPHNSANNLDGTYVGVASPILASTLRSKDGKGAAFMEDLQNTAKQVTISIIDQGEQLVPKVKRGPCAAKDTQQVPRSKYHNNNTACSPGPQVNASKDGLPAVLSISAGARPLCKLSSGRTIIPISPIIDNPTRPQLAPLPQQGSTMQQKVIQVTPKLRVTTGCESPLIQRAQPSSSKMAEKKWDKTKSPLSNLESIVKQKALETSALSGEGGCTPAPVGLKKPEAMSLHFRSQDAPSGGFLPFRPVKKRDVRLDLASLEGVPVKASGKPENMSTAELGKKTAEKHIKQEENTGSKESEERGDTSAHAQMVGGSGLAAEKQTESVLVPELGAGRVQESPCPLEGIALSILKGHRADRAEREKELNTIRDGPPAKGEASVSKHKKASQNKLDKSSPASSKKVAKGIKRALDKDSSTSDWTHHRKKKQRTPVLEPVRSDTAASQRNEELEEKGSGQRDPADATLLPHIKAGNDCSSVADTPGSQGSPDWLSKEAGPVKSRPPKQKRGRRRADKPRGDAPVPPPPATQTQARRPRGRPRSTPLPNQAGLGATKPAPATERDPSPRKKRKRRRNRKYQNGEFVTERDQAREGDAKCVTTRQTTRAATDQRAGSYPRLSATLACRGASPDGAPRRPLLTRSGGATRASELGYAPSSPTDKPTGKRKFKSKHLCDLEEEQKLKTKRGVSGKCSTPVIDAGNPPVKKPPDPICPPRDLPSPSTGRRGGAGVGGRGGRVPDSPPGRPVPPEVRRLIVNKNAGETLLQRAARLGYQEVVLYCLEKDEREVNRRDNAGYTALHEACARGWTHIVQVLLEHGAHVNCSAQDGTRGRTPHLATYSGQTAIKLAQSQSMKTFLKEYFADLDGRTDQDLDVHWDFYSSAVFETGQKACWDFLLSFPEEQEEEEIREKSTEKDCFVFEFSSQPLLPCYYIQVSLSQGFCNWFLLSDVLKRLKMSARIFRARYPHLEVVSISWAELRRQVSISQVTPPPEVPHTGGDEEEEGDGQVELVRCVSDLQSLLGSSLHFLEEEPSDTSGPTEGWPTSPAQNRSRTGSPPSKTSRSSRKEER